MATTTGTYVWRKGFMSRGVSAEVVKREIERIEIENGKCDAHLLLAYAKDKESILHPLFEWDNDKAAEGFRLTQARRVIASVRVIRDPQKPPELTYVHVRTTEDEKPVDQYMELDIALTRDDTARSVKRDVLRQLVALANRGRQIAPEWFEIWDAIEELNEEVAELYE